MMSQRTKYRFRDIYVVLRVPLCLSPRRNWDSPTPSPASVYPPPWTKGGGPHSPVGEGVGALCLLCVLTYFELAHLKIVVFSAIFLFWEAMLQMRSWSILKKVKAVARNFIPVPSVLFRKLLIVELDITFLNMNILHKNKEMKFSVLFSGRTLVNVLVCFKKNLGSQH